MRREGYKSKMLGNKQEEHKSENIKTYARIKPVDLSPLKKKAISKKLAFTPSKIQENKMTMMKVEKRSKSKVLRSQSSKKPKEQKERQTLLTDHCFNKKNQKETKPVEILYDSAKKRSNSLRKAKQEENIVILNENHSIPNKSANKLNRQASAVKFTNKKTKPIVFVKEGAYSIKNLKNDEKFEYERVFDSKDDNATLFKHIIKPNIDYILEGNNFAVMMYGQTCSGKTYTMRGEELSTTDKPKKQIRMLKHADDHFKSTLRSETKSLKQKETDSKGEEGLIQKTIRQLFHKLSQLTDRATRFQMSYFEIYNENIYDLLNNNGKQLSLFDEKDKLNIKNLTKEEVNSSQEALGLFYKGEKQRTFASTNMNHNSSRSHVILEISIETRFMDANTKPYVSNIVLVDLAGSESVGKSKKDTRFKEGTAINSSLLFLTNLIKKLNSGEKFVSYRDSKLTRILQPHLTGKSRTSIVCTFNPLEEHLTESLNTLNFGKSAGGIKLMIKKKDTTVVDRRRLMSIELKETVKAKEELAKENEVLKKDLNELKQENQAVQKNLKDIALAREMKDKCIENMKTQIEGTDKVIAELKKELHECYEREKEMQKAEKTKINLKNTRNSTRLSININPKRNSMVILNQERAKDSGTKREKIRYLEAEVEKIRKLNEKLVKENKCYKFQLNFTQQPSSSMTLLDDPARQAKRIKNEPDAETLNRWLKQLKKKLSKSEKAFEKQRTEINELESLLGDKNKQIYQLKKLIMENSLNSLS